MLYQALLKLAHREPRLRSLLLPILRKYAWEKPGKWDEFLAERYNQGKRLVPNPNPETQERWPRVELLTALENESVRERTNKEYLIWLKAQERHQKRHQKNKPFPEVKPQVSWSYKRTSDSSDLHDSLQDLNAALDLKTNITEEGLLHLMGLPYAPWENPPRIHFSAATREQRMKWSPAYRNQVNISVTTESSPIETMSRKFLLDKNRQPFIRNVIFMVDKKKAPEGWGRRIFINQVAQASKAGFKYISCEAEMKPPEFVGALVWPKLGYDGVIPQKDVGEHPELAAKPIPPELVAKLEAKGFRKPFRISQLWQIEGGPDWWEHNAVTFDATFDLTEGSYSMNFLRDYLTDKSKAAGVSEEEYLSGPLKKAGAGKKASGENSEKGHEELEPDAFDDAFSRDYWKRG